jgi:hypothetical protein
MKFLSSQDLIPLWFLPKGISGGVECPDASRGTDRNIHNPPQHLGRLISATGLVPVFEGFDQSISLDSLPPTGLL